MNRFRFHITIVLIFIFFIVGLISCTFPFTTATYKWNIKWDKDKLKFKDKFVDQKLEAYSKGKLPNILFVVVDDLGK